MPLTEFSLEGKRALVIAAGRGIGKGIVLAFADAGADVAVASFTATNAQAVAQQVRDMGRQSAGYTVDATKGESMAKFADQVIGEFGPLEIVVNCLGDHITSVIAKRPGRDEKVATEELWRTIMDVNLTEAFLGCNHFGPHLLEQGKGTVINISGMHGVRPEPGFIPYASAKAALNQFTVGVALEWAPYGVTCNCIAPGFFPDAEHMPPERFPIVQERLGKLVPLKRIGTMREVGLLAVYLASDAARYITGHTIPMDGGFTIAPTQSLLELGMGGG